MSIADLVKKHEQKQGKTGWFKLKDDGDTALTRILHTNEDDLEAYEVHKFEIDGYTKAVKCLGENCPACRNGNSPSLRAWISLQNLDKSDKPVELWERGLNDIREFMGLIAENGNLNERDYKIKRNGKAGSTKTKYQYFYKDKDIRHDLPERPKILGRYVLELNERDMQLAMEGRYSQENTQGGTSNNNQRGTSNTSAF